MVLHAASAPCAPAAVAARPRARSFLSPRVTLALVLLVVAPAATSLHASPQFGGQATLQAQRLRDASREPQPEFDTTLVYFPGGVLWQTVLTSPPAFPPTFDDTRVFALLKDDTLAALSSLTGGVDWTVRETATHPPASAGGVVAGIRDHDVWVRDGHSGALRWTASIESMPTFGPMIVDGGVLAATSAGDLICLSLADGRESWRVPLNGTPTVVVPGQDGTVVAGLADGSVVALAAADGTPRWRRRVGARVLTLTAVDRRVYAGTAANLLFALDAGSGREAWRWRTGGDPAGHVVVSGNRLAHVSMDSTLWLHNRRTGSLIWRQSLPSRPLGSPVFLHDRVLQADISWTIRGFDLRTGKEAGLFSHGDRMIHEPAIAPATDGLPARLILLTWQGVFMALGRPIDGVLVAMEEVPGTELVPETTTDWLCDAADAPIGRVLGLLLPNLQVFPLEPRFDDPPLVPTGAIFGHVSSPDFLLPIRLLQLDARPAPLREPHGIALPREVLLPLHLLLTDPALVPMREPPGRLLPRETIPRPPGDARDFTRTPPAVAGDR